MSNCVVKLAFFIEKKGRNSKKRPPKRGGQPFVIKKTPPETNTAGTGEGLTSNLKSHTEGVTCGEKLPGSKGAEAMEQVFEVGDVVTLKKPHPCKSHEFEILRVGADFRLKCRGCGHQFMVERKLVEKNCKGIQKKLYK